MSPQPNPSHPSAEFSGLENASAEFQSIGPRSRESYWRRVGGGSLGMSLLVHGVFFLIAIFLIRFAVESKPEESVGFLPGSNGGGANSQSKQASKRKAVSLAVPNSRLVAAVTTSNVSLPEVPFTFSEASITGSSPLLAGSGGGKGIGKGLGDGSGNGSGLGNSTGRGPGMGKGFVATIFGSLGGGDGLRGSIYDMKQGPDQTVLSYDPSVQAYADIINDSARSHFSNGSLRRYYKANQSMNFSFLAVPRLPADEGPKAFGVEKEIKPSGWFVHYAGTVTPPESGPWRFVGFFDDCLMVFVNSRPVLDGSWDKMIFKKDEGIRESFGGPDAAEGGRKNYAGKWFTFKPGDRLDIIVGERPGGLVGGMLLIEKKGEKYEKHPDGSPILPLFSIKALSAEELARVDSFSKSKHPYPIASKTPVFGCKPLTKDRMEKPESDADAR